MKQTRGAAALLTVLALAGCTAPPLDESADVAPAAAREESRDRVSALVASLTVPQSDAFAFARAASDPGAEGVELIGIESYEAETPDGPFGSLSFRTPVDPALFPDAGVDAFCFRVPLSAAGPTADGGAAAPDDAASEAGTDDTTTDDTTTDDTTTDDTTTDDTATDDTATEDGGVEEIDCPADATEITPPPAEG
ncbi:hypothetical protein [Rathayibacter oskolensis]|uniref:hypothetical protein n=1 Tax=Rathayibacter oskolensis TaxID=1891671 RepID=UPI000A1CC37C|nr:hypothetical protein [Rathayibacter oskolensis]